ncbi:cilia- and flagella-associated protein 206-like [Corticium candelabrum]|uniref:cilia- and flagella-associated protein 206-like n=1 Tax=Corticium candelabrum TaxID=121492 RepID=UPI002E263E6A|nr:cilia- and flagella-associated protein 206-like [Corticium candelabrum]
MSRAQAESVIKSIIREIAQECAGRGHTVSETLVAFMVKAVVLHPNHQFNVDRSLTKDDVHKLVEVCVEKLVDTASPSLDTAKMQVYFDMNYTTRNEFLEEHRRVLESRLQPTVRSITDSRARTREEFEGLYRQIVSFVLLRSGLGRPADIPVSREATAALQSVFPQTELGNFMQLTKQDKERQLKELTHIVTGIRLFNREGGKGGQGIDDLRAILGEAIPTTMHSIDTELHKTQNLVWKYTAIIERASQDEYRDEVLILELIKQAAINCRQHEVFLQILWQEAEVCSSKVNQLADKFDEDMSKLKNTVQSKTAVSTSLVYPLFVCLSTTWMGFQEEMVLLSVLSNILTNLGPFARAHCEKLGESQLQPLLEDVIPLSDETRIEKLKNQRVDHTQYPRLEWIFPENTKEHDRLPIEHRGFCSYSLAAHDRLLLPSSKEFGVLHYKGKFYCFSSPQAAEMFAANPDRYIYETIEVAKKSPELIQLLELHSQFAAMSSHGHGMPPGKMIEKPITTNDVGVQTEVHPIETNIVKSYEWNEWELRRKAIKLANLRRKVTHSVQTDLSHYRRDNDTQVYLPKKVETQTKRVKHTNVPQPSRYIVGLRGDGQKRDFTTVDLTLDVHTHNIAEDYEPKKH